MKKYQAIIQSISVWFPSIIFILKCALTGLAIAVWWIFYWEFIERRLQIKSDDLNFGVKIIQWITWPISIFPFSATSPHAKRLLLINISLINAFWYVFYGIVFLGLKKLFRKIELWFAR